MYAERIKSQGGEITPTMRFAMEVLIPSFSVCALLGITTYITTDAIAVITTNGSEADDVGIYFLYGFASANFVVDLISTMMFYIRRNEVFFDISKSGEVEQVDDVNSNNIDDEAGLKANDMSTKSHNTSTKSTKSVKNLNMISAFTHVGGDTLRTIAVFIAAVVADTTSVAGSVCDAWAAVIVSITIFGCVVPLSYEIYQKWKDFYAEDEE